MKQENPSIIFLGLDFLYVGMIFDLLTWATYLTVTICIVGRPIRLNSDNCGEQLNDTSLKSFTLMVGDFRGG